MVADASTEKWETLKVELTGGVGLVTLNRPDIGNLWSDKVSDEVYVSTHLKY